MDPSLCQITLHSFQRAFLITKQEEEPVLFFKKNLMQHDWHGLRKAPEQGLKILKEPITSAPDLIPPTPLEPETYEDISSLSGALRKPRQSCRIKFFLKKRTGSSSCFVIRKALWKECKVI